ncbi:unnamed protein product [Dovyalis caffra]|uniref:THH1/TOM1/TOM3 domain-containing protein n=1 Tax=Dovyalis caffra TaxID=77055 RepID=A0AAV1S9T2_9ROSI|nr:unnamed protein product [Dovyalis caffra]
MNLSSSCYSLDLLIVNIALACIDGTLASIAFSQVCFLLLLLLMDTLSLCIILDAYEDSYAKSTIWMDTPERYSFGGGVLDCRYSISWLALVIWPFQKPDDFWRELHPLSNLSKFTILCKVPMDVGTGCDSNGLSELVKFLAAFPKILFFAAFLLLLSFCLCGSHLEINDDFAFVQLEEKIKQVEWVDLCHQANEEDDDDEENSSQQPLLESAKNKPGSANTDGCWRWCSLRGIHVGSRQKFVITVVVLIFLLMLSFAVIIWIGVGKNPIDSSVVARVYVDFFATAILILGGALGCYGLVLFLKLRKVRSETASSEMRKVAGLAVVSVVCFTSSAAIALSTDIPVLPPPCLRSSVPSAFVLWVMRELPTPVIITQAQPRAVTFISYGAEGTQNPRHWVAATTSKNQREVCPSKYLCVGFETPNSEFYSGRNHKKEGVKSKSNISMIMTAVLKNAESRVMPDLALVTSLEGWNSYREGVMPFSASTYERTDNLRPKKETLPLHFPSPIPASTYKKQKHSALSSEKAVLTDCFICLSKLKKAKKQPPLKIKIPKFNSFLAIRAITLPHSTLKASIFVSLSTKRRMISLILTTSTNPNIADKIAKTKETSIIFTQLENQRYCRFNYYWFCGLGLCNWRWRVRAGPGTKEVRLGRTLGE